MATAELSVFFAYPSQPGRIGETVEYAAEHATDLPDTFRVSAWRENDIAGRFIGEEVLNKIDETICLAADVTVLNFNVTFEVGYAIGSQRRVILTKNRAIEGTDASLRTELGIYDTLGIESYENSEELLAILQKVSDTSPLPFKTTTINTSAPVYLLEPKYKTDQAIRMTARIKKARLFFRSFDPMEQPRMSAHEAIENVAQSAGILLMLVPELNPDAKLNNLRASFLAGLAYGMGKVVRVLQDGDEPVPLDYRDLVTAFLHPAQLDEAIAEFAPRVTEALQATTHRRVESPKSFLSTLTLGASSAENEFRELGAYYLETDQFRRVSRGEARLVVGRKGSGKTALFSQLRDTVRRYKSNIVIDLKPEGYKLRKFNESVGKLISEGTFEHTIMAFWEYLLLLEICYKVLEKDKIPHTRNHNLFEPYRRLAELYESDEYVSEGDFSERMSILLDRIIHDYTAEYGRDETSVLSQAQVTELIYRHDVSALRNELISYMQHKGQLWVLMDNLDKGWPTHGIGKDELLIIRTLLEATRKIERDFNKADLEAHSVVFLRNDVYELLIEETPDRGKESKVVLDWTDPALLRELLRRRLVFNGLPDDTRFEEIWLQICASHFEGEETSQYLIDRCLMRPRSLIDLMSHCRAHAVNLQRDKIMHDDIVAGLKAFSSDMLIDISYEIRDVVPEAEEMLYNFIGVSRNLYPTDYEIVLTESGVDKDDVNTVADILLWYGFLGVTASRDNGTKYIYSVDYDMKRLRAAMRKGKKDKMWFTINPAFWMALEIQ